MHSFAHWTPRYIGDRLLTLWYERTHPDAPWLTPTAIEILDSWLQPSDVGFEWGSGRSTLWFAKRVGRLTSVEHDPTWFDRVRRSIPGSVDYRLHLDGTAYSRLSEYVRAVHGVPDASLDFALVDGVSRGQCAEVVLPKLKRGALLVIDNANLYLPTPKPPRCPTNRAQFMNVDERQSWDVVRSTVSAWRCVWTSNGVTDTAIWVTN